MTLSSLLFGSLMMTSTSINAYPIDGYLETGISRLEYYRLSETGEIKGKTLHEGAKRTTDEIRPRLINVDGHSELPKADKSISARLAPLIPDQPGRYSIALLDLTDPDAPVYAEHNSNYQSNVCLLYTSPSPRD